MLCNDALKVSIPAGAEIAAGIMEVVVFRFKESDVGRDLLSFSIGIGSLTTLLLLPQSGPVLVLLGEECLRFRAFFETTSSIHVFRKSSSFVEEGGEESCCLFGRRRLLRGVFVWLVFTLKYANFNFILKRRARLSFGDAGIGREGFLWGCSVAVVIVMLYYSVLLVSLLFSSLLLFSSFPFPCPLLALVLVLFLVLVFGVYTRPSTLPLARSNSIFAANLNLAQCGKRKTTRLCSTMQCNSRQYGKQCGSR